MVTLDPLAWATTASDRITTNLRDSFATLSPYKAIRLVVIICGYLLIRPYLMKWAGAQQMKQHEAEEEASRAERERIAAMSPNELRGLKVAAEIPGSDADLEAESSSTDWGTRARRRQREVLRRIMDAEEKRLEEITADEEDKDIEEFLEKE